MNKILIATDIHGSAYWAKRVADKFDELQCDNLVLLGDIYNHGPRNPLPQEYAPIKVAEIFNALADKLIVLKGNCDSEVDGMISKFTFLQHNILLYGKHKVFLTHGHIYSKHSLPPQLSQGDLVVYGHYHIDEITDVNGVFAVNVGSASLPNDGHHAYAVLDKDGIALYDFDGGELARHSF